MHGLTVQRWQQYNELKLGKHEIDPREVNDEYVS